MTEAAYAYHEDVMSRSNLKKSATYKKNGINTQKLGNRPITNEEIRSKHGDVRTYNMGGLMSYSEFTEMPNDLKVAYVNRLCDDYDISICHISRYLFNKGDDGLRSYLRNNKILNECNPQKARGKTGLARFQDDILVWKNELKNIISLKDFEARKRKDMINNCEFIRYDEFMLWDLTEQIAYCNALIDKYHIGLSRVSTGLFNKDISTLRAYFKRNGALDRVHTKIGGERNTEYVSKFMNDVIKWRQSNLFMGNRLEYETDFAAIEEGNEKDAEKNMEDLFTKAAEAFEAYASNSGDIPQESEAKDEIEKNADMEYQRHTHFSSSYISVGLNSEELEALVKLFANKRVKVNLDISVL